MATTDNLKEAFAGESQANRRYLAFAKKADAEGRPQIARLFRAAAEAETVHALAHFRVLGGVKTGAENLQAAVAGEAFESQSMYPKFVAEAQAEKNPAALASFSNAMAVEKIHHRLFTEALATLTSGADLPAGRIHVCQVCGNTVTGDVPDPCPVCGSGRGQFVEVK